MYMNALWLERMAKYRTTDHARASTAVLLTLKDGRREVLVKKFHKVLHTERYVHTDTIEQLLLTEARNAKSFWRVYAELFPEWCNTFSRTPRAKDAVNRLLDIGYHHLATVVEKNINAHGISPALGLIHRAHRSDSMPLVYDLMEIFRADCVDMVMLTFLRQKKKPLIEINQRTIGMLLHNINKQLKRQYYLATFKQCHEYRYYMDLQITKFIKAVNRGKVFEPLALPTRHDERCSKQLDSINVT